MLENVEPVTPAGQLAAAVRRVLAHWSGGEDELVAKGRRDRPAGFQRSLQMCLRRLLEAEQRLTPVTAMRVTAGQKAGLGDPDPVLVPPELHLPEWNNHRGKN
jgi:hypothetical protein